MTSTDESADPIFPFGNTEHQNNAPFYQAICDEKGYVWLRVQQQTFRLAYDPIDAEKTEQISGHGRQHGEWIAKQLQRALDKIRTGLQ